MRPPEFTGGNLATLPARAEQQIRASMRPPEFTGGNMANVNPYCNVVNVRFNEAAGIHRRKLPVTVSSSGQCASASMRPPEFTGGNVRASPKRVARYSRFNEAAGIHRRKHGDHAYACVEHRCASMRPPEFTGGNAESRSHVACDNCALQ